MLIHCLSQLALGPVYGLYTIDGSAPDIGRHQHVNNLMTSRHGQAQMSLTFIERDEMVYALPSITLGPNCEKWLVYLDRLS